MTVKVQKWRDQPEASKYFAAAESIKFHTETPQLTFHYVQINDASA